MKKLFVFVTFLTIFVCGVFAENPNGQMWIISSYNEKLIKNFLFYLVENSPKRYPNEYDLTIISRYDKEHEELVLLDEKTKINNDNTLTKRYSYKLELK